MIRKRFALRSGTLLLALGFLSTTALGQDSKSSSAPKPTPPKPDFPPASLVLKDFVKVVSTSDGSRPMYTLYRHRKDQRLLAELPSSFASQKYFLASTVASGSDFAGYQYGDLYFYWRRYGKRLALMQPQIKTRSTGDRESQASVKRLFTDKVLLDTPIICIGPTGGPVIDLNSLLVSRSSTFFDHYGRFTNPGLVTIKKAKAFPGNVEVAFEGPVVGHLPRGPGINFVDTGQLKTLHYSISVIRPTPGFKPREADSRVGYFTTSYDDYGKYKDTEIRKRYITRWHLAKRDPSLKLSPPVKPITFYLEHTVPVRYRRYVQQGIEYWNEAFEKVGILNAISVDYQDSQTGRNMDLDPEDVRYNFIRWLNNDLTTAIGPSRINPTTGEILDADIILTDGWIRHYFNEFSELLPATAMEGMGPETLAWFVRHPRWDPRVRLAAPGGRDEIIRRIQREAMRPLAGSRAARVDTVLMGDDPLDGLIDRTTQMNGLCLAAQGRKLDIAMAAMHFALVEAEKKKKENAQANEEKKDDDEEKKDNEDSEKKADDSEKKDDKDAEEKEDEKRTPAKKEAVLDGMPESFIGPLLADLVAHEVGHTLGLRHNFKASTIYDLKGANGDGVKGKKPLAGSVMDYLPVNMGTGPGEPHGDWAMIRVGPYDIWAIEYGYTLNSSSLKSILGRVNEPELIYGTDEETDGPDPRARRNDLGKDPLDFANARMNIVRKARGGLIDGFVKEGEPWARARYGYQLTLAVQTGTLNMMANWVGGAFISRAKKGDQNSSKPIRAVSADQQRAALKFVIENAFRDEAFGLTPELLAHLSVDKWIDQGRRALREESSWPVHDKVAGIQASTLSMLMHPTKLRRIFDNELLVPRDQDALTLPELLSQLTDAIWTEVDGAPKESYSARAPMVSSLRRNLQQEHVARLIDLSKPADGDNESAKPISNLATVELDRVLARVTRTINEGKKKLDPYTTAHLRKVREQITKLKKSQYIYNHSDLGGGGFPPVFFLERSQDGTPLRERRP